MPQTTLNSSRKIGVLTSSLGSVFVKDAFQGFEAGIKGSPYQLELLETEGLDIAERNQFIEQIALEKKFAALVYAHLPINAAQVALFKAAHIPLAYLAGRIEGVDWFMVDEVMGAYLATKHLLLLKHHGLALVSGPMVAPESRLREDGFLKAVKEVGLDLGVERDIKILNFTEGEGYVAANLLLDLPEPPTAIFVSAGDLTALGVMTAVKDRGFKVPQDISIVGYDDLQFAATLDPPLTTVKQPLKEMGKLAIERLLAALENPAAHETDGELFEPLLVIRQSTSEANHG